MNLTRLNMLLAGLLLIVAILAITIHADYSRPNWEFLPEMKRSPAWSAYEANPNFSNGRTLQIPVDGTIPHGELPLHYAPTKEDAQRAGEELQNPYALASAIDDPVPTENKAGDKPLTKEEAQALLKKKRDDRLRASIERGVGVYGIFCVSCHGPKGAGDGPVAKRGFPPPPPLPTGKSAQRKDGQLFHILSYGQGSMAPMAAQLTRSRRWDVINYIRSLQEAAKEAQKSPETTNDKPPEATPKPTGKPSESKGGQP